MMALEPSPARDFLAGLGAHLPRPRAVLIVSAHHDARFEGGRATVTAAATPETIHDFGGFPDELFAMRYPAPGDPQLAQHVVDLCAGRGLQVVADPDRGLDHGAWVPLSLLYPGADVPVVQLSIASDAPPEWHYDLGRALAPLRDEGVLVIGSGSLTHNLRVLMASRPPIDAPAPLWVSAFADWVAERLSAGAIDDVLHAVERAPYGRDNHPTPDHILPLFVAMGAGSDIGSLHAQRLHASTTYALLAMDVYAFGSGAAAL